ncbi:MAG: signal peptide peptidase SppA, partial [Candidatus Rokuibacteriota bacterium]
GLGPRRPRRDLKSVALLAVALLSAGCISLDLTPRIKALEERTVEGSGRTKILLTDISGFLSEEGPSQTLIIGAPNPRVGLLVRFREELKKAAEDSDVKALIVRINSPGGTVTASDILLKELQMFKRATKMPVIAVMMDVAASGGYYVALGADTIVAHPTTVTGSIGVIMVTVNAEGLMRKLGIAAGAVKSGDLKDMGSPFRGLTAEERRVFQSVIDGLQDQFLARLVESRKLPMETAKRLADGRVYTAQQALDHKLIDRVGYMDDAVELTRKAIGVDQAKVVVYHRPSEYRATYYARSEAPVGSLDVSLSRLATVIGSGPGFFYLWWP